MRKRQSVSKNQLQKKQELANGLRYPHLKKNQVYAIEEKIVALEKEKLDTLASLGVIDKATADAQKKQLDERLANWKSSGEYPSGKGAKGSKSDVSKGTRSTDKQAS